jgi:hypothetical protein
MIGIKTQRQRYLNLSLGIEKSMNGLLSTSSKCFLMKLPNECWSTEILVTTQAEA